MCVSFELDSVFKFLKSFESHSRTFQENFSRAKKFTLVEGTEGSNKQING